MALINNAEWDKVLIAMIDAFKKNKLRIKRLIRENNAKSRVDEGRGIWINGTFIAVGEGKRRRRNRLGQARGKAKG